MVPSGAGWTGAILVSSLDKPVAYGLPASVQVCIRVNDQAYGIAYLSKLNPTGETLD